MLLQQVHRRAGAYRRTLRLRGLSEDPVQGRAHHPADRGPFLSEQPRDLQGVEQLALGAEQAHLGAAVALGQALFEDAQLLEGPHRRSHRA